MLKYKRIIGSTVIMVLIISQVLFSFPFNTPQVKEAKAATRLGLHVTQEELNIWKQRATNGPYKNKGDVSTNSPGDWTRMLSQANAFVASPAADCFAGQVSASCVPRADTFPDMHFALGDKLLNAGFVYLVTGATSYRDAVRTELLAQAGVTGTNFADSTRWCLSEGNDADNFFNAAIWLVKLLHGYDYIRASLSTADRTTLDTWFSNAATFFEGAVASNLGDLFVNRKAGNYTLTSYGSSLCSSNVKVPYFGVVSQFEFFVQI
jgi:hypothetical protein